MNTTTKLGLKIPTDTEIADYQTVAEHFDYAQFIRDNFQNIDDKLGNVIVNRLVALGLQALVFQGSAYLKNDNNLFGYLADGITAANLATMEQNDIAKFGDYNAVTWIAGKGYVSIRSPKLNIAEELNADGTSKKPLREVYHEGNKDFHATFGTNAGTQSMTKGTRNKINIITNVTSQFPAGNAYGVDGGYKIPRDGRYLFSTTVRPSGLTLAQSVLRFGLFKNDGVTETAIDLQDVIASSAYGTGFYTATYMYDCKAGDIMIPFVNPLSEAIVAQAGTKHSVYFLGGTIQA